MKPLFLAFLLAGPLFTGLSAAQTPISGNLSDDTTGALLTGTVYHQVGDVTVPSGKTLTIQPGVVIKAGSGRQFIVAGELLVNGTDAQPVHLTSLLDDTVGGDSAGDGPTTPSRGDWGRVYFTGSGSGTVTELHVAYAGWMGTTVPNVHFAAANPVLFTACSFTEGYGDGFNVYGLETGTFVDCEFSDNNGDAFVGAPLQALEAWTGNFGSGNGGLNEFAAINLNQSGDLTLGPDNTLNGVLVVRFNMRPDGNYNLSFLPGLVLKFDGPYYFNVSGAADFLGTEEDPIVLTAIEDDDYGGDTGGDGPTSGTPGSWRGLQLQGNASGSHLRNVIVRYAGYTGAPSVRFFGDIDATLEDCLLEYGSHDALDLSHSDGSTITGCTFQHHGGFAVENVALDGVPGFSFNTATGCSDGNVMVVRSYAPETDTTIAPGNILNGALRCQHAPTHPLGTTLTLEAGVILKFTDWVHRPSIHGDLQVNGTSDSPVVLTSIHDDAWAGDTGADGATTGWGGAWSGLILQPSATGHIGNLLVRYGGHNSVGGAAFESSSTSLVFEHVRTEWSGARGFRFRVPFTFDPSHLTAWQCAGTGIQLEANGYTVRRATVVACGGHGLMRIGSSTAAVLDSIAWSNSPANLSGLVAADVHYTNGTGAWAGSQGNLDTDPGFVDEANGDLRLALHSSCIDSGDPLSPLDPDLSRADMGAEYFDHCRPRSYCTAKVGSAGCVVNLGWSGDPSFTGADDFHITASGVGGGLTLYPVLSLTPNPSNGSMAPSVRGQRLCVSYPSALTTLSSGGTPGACDGALDYHLDQATMVGWGLTPGTQVYLQVLVRDPSHPDGTGWSYSDALTFRVCP